MGKKKMKPKKEYELYCIFKDDEILEGRYYNSLQEAKDAAQSEVECCDDIDRIDGEPYEIFGLTRVSVAYPEKVAKLDNWDDA